MSWRCRVHGYTYEDGELCSDCEREREEAREQQVLQLEALEELRGTLEASRYTRDTGDFVCPHCRYKTLRLDAPLCPECRSAVPEGFWARIHSERRAAAEAARVAEAARAAAQREAAARHAQHEAERKTREQRKAVGAFVVALLFCVPIFAYMPSFFAQRQTSRGIGGAVDSLPVGQLQAPEFLVDSGACQIGEQSSCGIEMMARSDVPLYTNPPRVANSPMNSLRVARIARRGEWVMTTTALVLSTRGEGVVSEGLRDFGPSRFHAGQTVAVYTLLGESCVRTWFDGRFDQVCAVDVTTQPTNEWWIQARFSDGTLAWTNQPSAFASRFDLDDSLAVIMADSTVSLPNKLTLVEAALRLGADLNGSGSRHGIQPRDAAVQTNDTALVRALMLRGMTLVDPRFCPFDQFRFAAFQPGGDVMLAFLLANGVSLSCLGQTPLHAYLTFGVAHEDFPVDRAIRIAEVLVKNGADVRQKDALGKTVLDHLADPKWSAKVAALREALVALSEDVGRQ